MTKSSVDKDRATLEAIGRIYCQAHHTCGKDAAGLCPDCRLAVDTTLARTQACPYGHAHNCQDCTTKCQRGQAQEDIRAIMRYAASRMMFRHPIMTLEYLRKKRRKHEV